MKLSKKMIILSTASLLIMTGASYGATRMLTNTKTSESVAVKQVSVQEPTKVDATVAEAQSTPDVTPVSIPDATVQTPVVAPVILSTQEYANKYLDMSVTSASICLDRLISVWPDRFNPDVREMNIKALRVWGNICATGVLNPLVDQEMREGLVTLHGSTIASYGEHGEFFDSPIAKSRWND